MTIDSANDSKISNRTINTNRISIGRTIRNRIESRSFAGPYYAASAWRGFTKVSDRQRIDAFLRRSKRCGYYATDLPLFDELCESADDQQLFDNV